MALLNQMLGKLQIEARVITTLVIGRKGQEMGGDGTKHLDRSNLVARILVVLLAKINRGDEGVVVGLIAEVERIGELIGDSGSDIDSSNNKGVDQDLHSG